MNTGATQRSAPEVGRQRWSGQLGFVLAAVGSAVGLGNIWRFPSVAYEGGGGAFLIPYLVALLTAGVPILLLDYSLGHRFRGAAPTVFRRLGRRLEVLGWFQVIICFVIATYYMAIIVWALRYALFSLDLAWGTDTAAFFQGDFLQAGEPGWSGSIVSGIFWPMLGLWLVTLAVLAFGVKKGIETTTKIFVPLLAVLFLILVVRALFLDGAADGLNAFFTPDWRALGDPGVWVSAYSQVFFSLSIAFGIMITYSSYLRRRSNLVPVGYVVAFGNASFEMLAGIGVFATLGFMAHQQSVAVGELEDIAGIGLSFITFPQIISAMPGGPFFGVLFFLSLTLAGFTSLISVLQVVIAAVQDKFALSRLTVVGLIGGAVTVVSLVLYSTTSALFILDTVDAHTNEIGVVASAILMCVVVGLVARQLPALRRHLNLHSTARVGRWWTVLVGAAVPLVLAFMLVSTLIGLISEPYEGYPSGFVMVFGWGLVALLVLGAIIPTLLPWRRPVDDFVPEDLEAHR